MLVLVGCGAARGPVAGTGAPHPEVARRGAPDERALSLVLLSDGPDEPRALRIARWGDVRFAVDGAVVATSSEKDTGDLGRELEYAVVDERATRVRILSETLGVRLLVWIDRDDVRPAIVETTGVAPEVDGSVPAPDRPGVFLEPGAVVAIAEEVDRARRVRLDGEIRAAGWVPRGAVGDVYSAADDADDVSSAADDADDEGERWVDAIDVFDAAGSTSVSRRIAHIEGAVLALVGPAIDGWQEIELDAFRVRVHGFVRAAELPPPGYGGDVFGTLGYGTNLPPMTLPPNTCLYSEPDGAVVGKTIWEDARGTPDRADGAWQRFRVESDWGQVTAWARHDEAAAGRLETWELCQSVPATHARR